ncbi:MAG: hypothetical protein QOE79_1944, partial [Sphingomonadales bacterium]|nr:hypothetical protein [Sphingomonadales bacterium]
PPQWDDMWTRADEPLLNWPERLGKG